MTEKRTDLDSFSRRTFLKAIGGSAVVTALPAAAAAERRSVGDAEILGPGKVKFDLTVNGTRRSLEVEPRTTLLDALRDHLDLTGAKKVCSMGECGGCTVLIDDVPHYGCLTLALDARGKSVTTVEGLEKEGKLSAVQQAFVEKDAMQCGFCTSGWIMTVEGLRRRGPLPDEAALRTGLTGNLCRCAAYPKILEAARAAASSGRGGK
jgi:xanthine dehydrogenase YagT iron-sulfur-binding subunit